MRLSLKEEISIRLLANGYSEKQIIEILKLYQKS